jgi:hypothetical protein
MTVSGPSGKLLKEKARCGASQLPSQSMMQEAGFIDADLRTTPFCG